MEKFKNFFFKKNILKINISEKFIGERGRINCSLKEDKGFWRWLGNSICRLVKNNLRIQFYLFNRVY